jgi:hypothetical protein
MLKTKLLLGSMLFFAAGVWLVLEWTPLVLRARPNHYYKLVRSTDLRQTINGFGGSSAEFFNSLTPAQCGDSSLFRFRGSFGRVVNIP